MMTLPPEISAPWPAHCIHLRVGTEDWIPAYRKEAGINSVGIVQSSPVHYRNQEWRTTNKIPGEQHPKYRATPDFEPTVWQ